MLGTTIKTVKHAGIEIEVKEAQTNYGTLFFCDNNYGEPRMNRVLYSTVEAAVKAERKELDWMF